MKLLITGGAGFIGSNFVHYWIKNHPDDQIVVLDKLTYAGNLANLENVKDKITFIEGDIALEKDVDRAMDGVDTVVHFAAESHVDRSINDPFVFSRTNVLGTHVLLEAARKNNIKRFHHVSTDEVFGDIPLEEHWKFNESSPYNPRSPYAASKAGSDHLVRAYGATYNVPFTISNCSNNFGTYHHPEKFIPRSIVRLLQGKNIPIYTPGNQIRDWLYVEDHCRAIELILEKGNLGETYCIGGMTEEISNLEVAKKIIAIMELDENRIEHVTDRPGHDVKYAVDWTKINRELGWQPLHSFDEWLKTTVEWYKNNEAWWQEAAHESEQFYQSKGETVLNK
jgi:dTDP-glucose 4,6-dehydratase